MCGKPLLEDIMRRGLVASNGCMPCTTLTICDENVTGLTIDAHKASGKFGGIGGFAAAVVHSMGLMMAPSGSRVAPSMSLVLSSTSTIVVDIGGFEA